MAQIKVYLGKKVERILNLDVDVLVVGRAQECDLVIATEVVSRRHCQIARRDQYYVVQDLGSTTGTFVNGAKVQHQMLNHGDRIALGKHTLEFDAHAGTTTAADAGSVVQGDEMLDDFWKAGLQASGGGPSGGGGMMTEGSHTPMAESASVSMSARMPDPTTSTDDFKSTMMASGEQLQKVRQNLLISQQAHLAVRSAKGNEKIPLGTGNIVVGYFDEAGYRLPGSKWFGKQQFRIHKEKDGFWYVTPLSWWANVLVDGVRIKSTSSLKDGGVVDCAGIKFKFSAGVEI